MHFVAIAQLKAAPTRRTTVALRAIRGLAMSINGLRLLTDQATNGF